MTSADDSAYVSRVSGVLRSLGHLANPSPVAFRRGYWLLSVAALAEAARAEALEALEDLSRDRPGVYAFLDRADVFEDVQSMISLESEAPAAGDAAGGLAVARVSRLVQPLSRLAGSNPFRRPDRWLLCVTVLVEAARSEALDAYDEPSEPVYCDLAAIDMFEDVRALVYPASRTGGGS